MFYLVFAIINIACGFWGLDVGNQEWIITLNFVAGGLLLVRFLQEINEY